MPFKKILVTLDGSQYSQTAANYAFWLALALDAELSGEHVVDPRLVDLFIEPEFAEELGLSKSIQTTDKVFSALRRIGKLILELFGTEASGRGLKVHTYLDEGYILDEILKRSLNYDLVIMGHRGRGHRKIPAELMVGSIAERVAVASKKPVLISVHPLESQTEILVAYDGSEPSRGALLMGEALAKSAGQRLRAIMVIPSASHHGEAQLMIEQGKDYLREKWPEEVFLIREGHPAEVLMEHAEKNGSLLVLGAYGFSNPDENVLGSTTTHVVRRARNSILVYR